eukprot:TRINITY_DN63365_c0_g1_i1.p1 TRINITY_DN63365_c0_g1~~TRINITY_DN63365_c0_g1_i1.p1  ORF type:complete len:507 (+),score=103.25 TRINITY_DN63365_c0_g1_i1:74-1522(+)
MDSGGTTPSDANAKRRPTAMLAAAAALAATALAAAFATAEASMGLNATTVLSFKPLAAATVVITLATKLFRHPHTAARGAKKSAGVRAEAANTGAADAADAVSGATAQAAPEDPVRWCFLPSGGKVGRSNMCNPVEHETERAHMRVIAMHRPTHERERDRTGDYPYSWHMQGRKRLWEIRMHMRLKQKPEGTFYFGLELSRYVPVPPAIRSVQKTMVSLCRSVVGCSLYHSVGDAPGEVEGELEPPTFVMPLWAIDQFVVSEPGEEPDLCGDFEGLGMRRTDGFSKYVAAMKEVVENLSTDKVYTFCFWGTSPFADVINWKAWGGVPGLWLNVNRFCGAPPLYVAMYELLGDEEQKQREEASVAADAPKTTAVARKAAVPRRHLRSQKRYYLHFALWSQKVPLDTETLDSLGISADTAANPPRDVPSAAATASGASTGDAADAPAADRPPSRSRRDGSRRASSSRGLTLLRSFTGGCGGCVN